MELVERPELSTKCLKIFPNCEFSSDLVTLVGLVITVGEYLLSDGQRNKIIRLKAHVEEDLVI